jgi:hypothetical protein
MPARFLLLRRPLHAAVVVLCAVKRALGHRLANAGPAATPAPVALALPQVRSASHSRRARRLHPAHQWAAPRVGRGSNRRGAGCPLPTPLDNARCCPCGAGHAPRARPEGPRAGIGHQARREALDQHDSQVHGTAAEAEGAQSWRTFVKNHASQVFAVDFLTQHSAFLTVVYVFVAMEVVLRRIALVNAATGLGLEWVNQQIRQATAWAQSPRLQPGGKFSGAASPAAAVSSANAHWARPIQSLVTPDRTASGAGSATNQP